MRKLCVFCLLLAGPLHAVDGSLGIKIDQVGYLPDAPKLAVVTSPLAGETFQVLDAASGAEILKGTLSAPREDADTGDRVQIADFSPVTAAGRYVIRLSGGERSFPFSIGPDVFRDAWTLSMRSFYGQRCGIAVDLGRRFPGYKHKACHLEDAAFHRSSGREGRRNARGGWHDAGDYGKYIVNSGITNGTLLWAWEWYGSRLQGLSLDIPESKNRIPDFLDEVKWNLDWMLALQDEDGGVWHKLTSERFGGFTLPEKDDGGPRFIIGTDHEPYKSTGATADFAAVMACAARVYAPFTKKDSDVYLAAARSAFDWAVAHPDVKFNNPSGVRTGGYGDGDLSDEILWAAAELYRTTGDPSYNRWFLEHLPKDKAWVKDDDPQAWPTVRNLALWAYAMADVPGADPATRKRIQDDTRKAARSVAARHAKNGYLNSMLAKNYIWGSNSVALNYSMLLLVADRFSPDAALRHAAWDNLHYVLGRNAFGVSWVTQVGSNPFLHPHHRPSGGDRNPLPWPGLLSGGPNAGRQDPAMQKTRGLPPAKAWVDEQASYAGNENAINWNAPLVFVLTATLPEPK